MSDDVMRDLEAAGVVAPDIASRLDALVAYVRRFVVFQREAEAVAVALWVVHTHAFEAADATPYISISSPERESGKSKLLEALALVVARPWNAVTPSEATIFRKIDKDSPTLLLDEVDTIFTPRNEREELRAILNAGFQRGQTIPRITGEGKNMKVHDFKTFCPKAIAGIHGRLPDTIASRSIPVRLQRKADHEHVDRFRVRIARSDAAELRDAIAAWAEANTDELRDVWPPLPDELSDRQQDVWEPLLAIADRASPEWAMRARAAAVELHSMNDDEPTIGVLLLAHVRDALDGAGHITTADLLAALVDREDGPWAEWWGPGVEDGKTRGPAARVGRLLRPYGIKSKKIRTGDKTLQGFERTAFEDVFRRYLPPVPSVERNNGTPQVEGAFQSHRESTEQAPDQGGSDVPSFATEQEEQESEPLDFDFPGGFGKCFVCDKLARSVWPEFEGWLHPGCLEPARNRVAR